MKFTLEIELGNEAMQSRSDIARALRKVSAKLQAGRDGGQVMDLNGNSVGSFGLIDTETDDTAHSVTVTAVAVRRPSDAGLYLGECACGWNSTRAALAGVLDVIGAHLQGSL